LSSNAKARTKAEFGDFQTPQPLADRVCALLADRGVRPASHRSPVHSLRGAGVQGKAGTID